jgi:hypothetical protein
MMYLRKFVTKLYAEEQKSYKRHQKATRTSITSHAPITIINVLPALPNQISHLVSSQAGTLALGVPLKYTLITRLNLPGY